MLDVDKKLIEAEEKAIIEDAQALHKLHEQRKVFKKIISPKFYLSQLADLFQKDKVVQASALVPMVACTAVGAASAVASSGPVVASVGMAAANGVLIGGFTGTSIAAVKIARKVGENLKQLEGYSPIKAKSQERNLIFSMRDRHLKIKCLEALFSNENPYQSLGLCVSHIRIVKSSSDRLPKNISKEKVRE